MVGFTKIIFHGSFFLDDVPLLTKLVFTSCLVHVLTFTSLSKMPFAVGAVQDAGLIFLSKMTGDIVSYLQDDLDAGRVSHADVLTTCLVTLG